MPGEIKRGWRILAPGWNAVIVNWRPLVAIQIACLALVVAYYRVPAIRDFCQTVARWKLEGGIGVSAFAMATAAVLIPEAARRFTKVARDKPLTWQDVAFQLSYFALLGVALDLFYRALAFLIGREPTPAHVSIKVACDMVVFSGVFSMPLAVLLFSWRDADFRLKDGVNLLRGGGFLERYLPLLVTCWAFWTPVMACLYSLPVNLQFVFAVLAEAAWCLLLVTAASRPPEIDKTIA